MNISNSVILTSIPFIIFTFSCATSTMEVAFKDPYDWKNVKTTYEASDYNDVTRFQLGHTPLVIWRHGTDHENKHRDFNFENHRDCAQKNIQLHTPAMRKKIVTAILDCQSEPVSTAVRAQVEKAVDYPTDSSKWKISKLLNKSWGQDKANNLRHALQKLAVIAWGIQEEQAYFHFEFEFNQVLAEVAAAAIVATRMPLENRLKQLQSDYDRYKDLKEKELEACRMRIDKKKKKNSELKNQLELQEHEAYYKLEGLRDQISSLRQKADQLSPLRAEHEESRRKLVAAEEKIKALAHLQSALHDLSA